jgi:hypothetical protein
MLRLFVEPKKNHPSHLRVLINLLTLIIELASFVMEGFTVSSCENTKELRGLVSSNNKQEEISLLKNIQRKMTATLGDKRLPSSSSPDTRLV